MLFGIILSVFLECAFSATASQRNPLLLILLDGFRHDYFDVQDLKGFPQFMQEGVKAEYMKTTYPSESFPGYYSIATGLYTESHGMILNYMYDEEQNKSFTMDIDDKPESSFWWDEAEPIWITSTKRGIDTGMFLWPGGRAVIGNTTAKIVKPYRYESEDLSDTLNSSIHKIKAGEIQFALVYSELVDKAGHFSGPASEICHNAVRTVDRTIKDAMKLITELNLDNVLNVIIVSDHGMTATDSSSVKYVSLREVLNPDLVRLVLDRGSHAGIYPMPGKNEEVLRSLKSLEGVDVYQKSEIPEYLHFKNNKRVPPIYVIVRKGYFLTGLLNPHKQIPVEGLYTVWHGFHGYIPDDPDMRAIFLAKGPAFKRNIKSPPISITDPYNLMMHLIGLDPLPNNGTWSNVKNMLKFVPEEPGPSYVAAFPPKNNVDSSSSACSFYPPKIKAVEVKLVWGFVAFSYTLRNVKP